MGFSETQESEPIAPNSLPLIQLGDLLTKVEKRLLRSTFPIYWAASSGSSQESRMMKSWKSRLLLVFTMLAVVLVLSVPATAEDVDLKVQCEADHGYCKKHVSQEVWHEDTGSDPQEDDLDLEDLVDEVSDEAPADEISDKDSSEQCWVPSGYYWPWPC